MNIVDLSYLESIAAGDNAFIRQMLEMFNSSTLPEIEKIEYFYSKEEWAMLGIIAHKIKTPIQMLGQPDITDMINTLEINAKNKTDIDQMGQLIGEIKERLIGLNDEINKLILTM